MEINYNDPLIGLSSDPYLANITRVKVLADKIAKDIGVPQSSITQYLACWDIAVKIIEVTERKYLIGEVIGKSILCSFNKQEVSSFFEELDNIRELLYDINKKIKN